MLDANIGQNALAQVKAFDKAIGVTGWGHTKLDGTAKGGVLAAIARQCPQPLHHFIGVGEASTTCNRSRRAVRRCALRTRRRCAVKAGSGSAQMIVFEDVAKRYGGVATRRWRGRFGSAMARAGRLRPFRRGQEHAVQAIR